MGFLQNLFPPGWKHRDPDKRRDAVSRLEDQKILKEIVLADDCWYVRKCAVDKLQHDETFFAEIAVNDTDWRVCEIAVKRLSRPELVTNVVQNAKLSLIGCQAVRLIDDQAVLKDVALNHLDSNVRNDAAKRIKDEDVLFAVIENDKEWRVCCSAVGNPIVADEGRLSDIAKNHGDRSVQSSALDKITDQAKIFEVASEGTSAVTRKEALWKLNNPEDLEKIYQLDNEESVRIEAIEKLESLKEQEARTKRIKLERENKHLKKEEKIEYVIVDANSINEIVLGTVGQLERNHGIILAEELFEKWNPELHLDLKKTYNYLSHETVFRFVSHPTESDLINCFKQHQYKNRRDCNMVMQYFTGREFSNKQDIMFDLRVILATYFQIEEEKLPERMFITDEELKNHLVQVGFAHQLELWPEGLDLPGGNSRDSGPIE